MPNLYAWVKKLLPFHEELWQSKKFQLVLSSSLVKLLGLAANSIGARYGFEVPPDAINWLAEGLLGLAGAHLAMDMTHAALEASKEKAQILNAKVPEIAAMQKAFSDAAAAAADKKRAPTVRGGTKTTAQ